MASVLRTLQTESHASYTGDHTPIGVIRMRNVKLCVQGLYPAAAPISVGFERENVHILRERGRLGRMLADVGAL